MAEIECQGTNDAFERFERREEVLGISWSPHGVSWFEVELGGG
jgi:hypothetical protein